MIQHLWIAVLSFASVFHLTDISLMFFCARQFRIVGDGREFSFALVEILVVFRLDSGRKRERERSSVCFDIEWPTLL